MLMDATTQFEQIREALIASDPAIEAGPMMRSPGIKHQGNMFAFLGKNQDRMVFKLGKGFDPASLPEAALSPFNPFKRKGPLGGWFESAPEAMAQWPALAQRALDVVKG